MTTRCSSLTSIVTFDSASFETVTETRFMGIIFGMWDLNVMTYEMFGNELGRIPPSPMWLIDLLTV
jgi:hypothetical protein